MYKCRSCHGYGVKVTYRQLGPGMSQQIQSRCPDCSGQGNVLLYLFCYFSNILMFTAGKAQSRETVTHVEAVKATELR